MPLTRPQLQKILADNKQELREAETALAEGSEAELEAEVIRYLGVLRSNVERIETMLDNRIT